MIKGLREEIRLDNASLYNSLPLVTLSSLQMFRGNLIPAAGIVLSCLLRTQFRMLTEPPQSVGAPSDKRIKQNDVAPLAMLNT